MFKLWSETNKKVEDKLKPNLGLRDWNDLTADEKHLIWKHLERYFFEKNAYTRDIDSIYTFIVDSEEKNFKRKRVFYSIAALKNKYKVKNLAKNFIESGAPESAFEDFITIFKKEDGDVVIEMLSIYCKVLINERAESNTFRPSSESVEDYNNRLLKWRWEDFDEFASDLNEVFVDFGVNVHLTRLGFVPRQDKKIIEEVYNPVMIAISNTKWSQVNALLSDAFSDYRRGTPQCYSNSVTNAIAAVEAFLQILVNNKTGGENLSSLIPKARKSGFIPQDPFTEKIFDNIESVFARERQETGIAHPKEKYATEKNARLILNLAMVFLQHCLQ